MEQIDRILSLVREVFGEDAVGAYLHGSAVLGGLRPDSDIDVLPVRECTVDRVDGRRRVGHPPGAVPAVP